MNRLPLLLALGLAPQSALACGGFFCDQNRPVDQAGEDILFAVDSDAGEVEMHVKIQYEGPAEEFAWILPAPADPELAVGADAAFDTLSTLRAQFFLNRDFGECAVPLAGGTTYSSSDAGGGVSVVRKGLVGPYETVTLQAADSTALISWLQANQFFVPDSLDPVLAPYLSSDGYFVALRLAKDKDAGDIEPLVMRYAGDMASIPIQLTSIAATPDMRLRVYVLGEHRAVPESYLHVKLNHLAIDWWNNGANLDDAITAAADEAGGHAFFTDYSGDTELLQNRVFRDQWDTPDWASLADANAVIGEMVTYGLPVTDELLIGLLADHLGLPESGDPGVDVVDVINCYGGGGYYGSTGSHPADCYQSELDQTGFDVALFAQDLEDVVLEPRRRVNALFAQWPTVSRMTSSVSPVEMTVDPTFVFNPDMGPVDQNRFADEIWFCTDGDMSQSIRELHLADGRILTLPTGEYLSQRGLTEFEWVQLEGLNVPAAAFIERTGASGQPEVVVDNSQLLADQLAELEGDDDAKKGCGCAQSPGHAGWLALLPLAAVIRRRR